MIKYTVRDEKMKTVKKSQRTIETEINAENGCGKLYLDSLLNEPNKPNNLVTYARAVLEVGASVGYHEHFGESESYYILSGVGEYNDDGELYPVHEGDVTYTPSGHGHGIKNIGDIPLEFIALIIKE